MTALPEFLLGSPHLPIKAGDRLPTVINHVRTFYGLTLLVTDFKPSQAFVGKDQKIYFDLIDNTGHALTRFVNHATGKQAVASIGLNTPVLTFGQVAGANWLAKEVNVFETTQLSIFDNYPTGYVYDAMETLNDLGHNVAKLLNHYTDKPVWLMSSFADYTTAKLKVVYKGPSSNAPADLMLPNTGDQVIVICIESGKHQGLICFRATR